MVLVLDKTLFFQTERFFSFAISIRGLLGKTGDLRQASISVVNIVSLGEMVQRILYLKGVVEWLRSRRLDSGKYSELMGAYVWTCE